MTQGQTNVQNVRHGDIAHINQHDKSLYWKLRFYNLYFIKKNCYSFPIITALTIEFLNKKHIS